MITVKLPAALLLLATLLTSPVHGRFIEHKEHHLGPTGLFGITSPTDIKITKVQEGSPADGTIKVGDVIVAAGGIALVDDKPGDPLGRFDEELGMALNVLCADPYAAGLVKDKKLFYAAAHKLLDHRRANARTTGAKLVARVPLEDFHYVADKISYIIDDQDLNYHSYHNLGAKTESIAILANLKIEGGIEAAFETLEAPTGKAGFKLRMLLAVLPKYGAGAKRFLPKIKATGAGKFQQQWDAMVKEIESAEGNTDMISFEDAKRAGMKGN